MDTKLKKIRAGMAFRSRLTSSWNERLHGVRRLGNRFTELSAIT